MDTINTPQFVLSGAMLLFAVLTWWSRAPRWVLTRPGAPKIVTWWLRMDGIVMTALWVMASVGWLFPPSALTWTVRLAAVVWFIFVHGIAGIAWLAWSKTSDGPVGDGRTDR